MTEIFYDLSEQFLAAGLKFKYYGIVRTVMEVGYELECGPTPVRFVVFSPAHDKFFEVYPRIGLASPTGILDPGLPLEARPIRLRYSFPVRNRIRDVLYPLVRRIVRRKNLKRWEIVSSAAAKEVDLSGQILVSLGRPKIMADYLTILERDGINVRFYPLLHDMIPLHEFRHRNHKMFTSNFLHDNSLVIRHAHKIIANSAFTKRDIESFAEKGHLPSLPPVVAVPLCHELRRTEDAVKRTGPEDKPYLLCLGILTGRKNLECVLNAMLLLHEQGRQVPNVVLAGGLRKRTRTYVSRKEFAPIHEKIHFNINPDQAEIRGLYKNALALVIPSRMEGWGLPLGEALWMGTPGLAATADALQEVGGELAQYFDPDDPSQLAHLIDVLQSDSEGYIALKTRIKSARSSLRTWSDVAEGILAAVDFKSEQSKSK